MYHINSLKLESNVTISTLPVGIGNTQQLSKQIIKLFFQLTVHVNSQFGKLKVGGWSFF